MLGSQQGIYCFASLAELYSAFAFLLFRGLLYEYYREKEKRRRVEEARNKINAATGFLSGSYFFDLLYWPDSFLTKAGTPSSASPHSFNPLLFYLSNTTPGDLTLKLGVEWQSGLISAPSISLTAHQTVVFAISQLLANLNISSKGIDKGGLSVSHNGAPGALIAHGVIFNKERRFASNINFVDPKSQKNSVLNGSGLMIGRPASGLSFSEDSFFTPQLTLKNTDASAQKATVTVSYTVAGETRTRVLPSINLSSHEVRAVDFKRFLTELLTTPVSSAGVEIEGSGLPGTLIAALSSIDQSLNTVVDVPLVSRSERSAEGGNHPFTIDENFRSVLYMTNITQKETKVLVAIFHSGGMFTPELLKVGPGETITVDLLQLRDSQIKDVQGRILPSDLSTGQVLWRPHKGEALIGRVIMINSKGGTASSFGCPNCCTYEPHQWVGSPDPFRGPPGGSQQMTLYEYGSICGCCFTGPYLADGILNIRSDNTSIATVTSGGMVSFISEGSANIVYSIQYWRSTFISSEDCGSEAIEVEVPCPVVVAPVVESLDHTKGVKGLEYNITITGRGFAAGATLNAGTGIDISDVQIVGPTQILATFTLGEDATAGDHPVIVTVRNQPSNNNVKFFVQIPTRIRRDGLDNIVTCDPNRCTIKGNENVCGAYRIAHYTLVDQSQPGQPIEEVLNVTETVTDVSDPNAPPEILTIETNAAGAFDDILAVFKVMTCPGNGESVSKRQKFTVEVGTQTFTPTTVNRIDFQKSNTGAYSIKITIETQ